MHHVTVIGISVKHLNTSQKCNLNIQCTYMKHYLKIKFRMNRKLIIYMFLEFCLVYKMLILVHYVKPEENNTPQNSDENGVR